MKEPSNPTPRASCLGQPAKTSNEEIRLLGEMQSLDSDVFFINESTVVFQGIFSIPYSATDAEVEDCRDRSCIYFPRAVIERNLGIASTKEYKHGTFQYVESLNRNMRDKFLLAAGNFEIEKADTIHSTHELLSWSAP